MFDVTQSMVQLLSVFVIILNILYLLVFCKNLYVIFILGEVLSSVD